MILFSQEKKPVGYENCHNKGFSTKYAKLNSTEEVKTRITYYRVIWVNLILPDLEMFLVKTLRHSLDFRP